MSNDHILQTVASLREQRRQLANLLAVADNEAADWRQRLTEAVRDGQAKAKRIEELEARVAELEAAPNGRGEAPPKARAAAKH